MNQKSAQFDPKESFKRAFEAHRSGNLDAAEGIYRKILSHQPENAHAVHLLGVIALQKGRADEARELIEAAIKREDGHALFHCNLGEAYRQLNQLEKAEKCFLAALERQADYPQALTNLGITLYQLGRHDDAVARLERALDLTGPSADGLSNLGLTQFAAGALDDAIATLRKAVELDPQHLEANNNLGTALLEKGDVEAAAFVLEEAVRVDPRAADAWSNLARARLAQSEMKAAEKCARRAIELVPNEAKFYFVLGLVLRDGGRPGEAEAALCRSLELAANQAMPHYVLGTLYIRTGRFKKAEVALKSALERKPDLAVAYEALSHIHSYGRNEWPEIDRLQQFATSLDLTNPARMHLEFALANMFDSCKLYDRAFLHLKTANELKRRLVDFDAAECWQLLDDAKRTVDRSLIEEKSRMGSESDVPILIVGMPRSGTTLVEQVLASHPEVSGSGEVGYLNAAARSLAQALGTPYPRCLGKLSRTGVQSLVEGYLNRLKQERGVASKVTDKRPHNFIHLGLISILFPKASIIHCLRDPMDTCLSIFFQNFEKENEFAYDLEDIGEYYQFYSQTVAYWKSVLPNPIFDIRYEEFVNDQERITRKLLEYCGLRWNDLCLSPHETDREIRTASHWQVRQPVYADSVARWQRYERHLEPLAKALGRHDHAASEH